ncbi:MAG: Ubiquinone biosynthesis O-methyltransferase [Ignavibacteria bacterium]|nr:Ubiquinone biosynthesis O-methyltransferase [Ignavibacteria bacterium]
MERFDERFEKCPICNSIEIFRFHKTSEETIIFKCKECEIQFLNPQYTEKYLNQYYSSYTNIGNEYEASHCNSHLECLRTIEIYGLREGKLFDIGCGSGALISIAKRKGWKVIGYDVDCTTVKAISEKTGATIYCGDFNELKMEDQTIDIVTMLHVLEHLKNPLSYFKKINQVLKPNGFLFIVLPNINSRSSIVKLFLEKIKLKRKNIGAYYDTEHHLFYFTPKSIRHFLNINGFEVKFIYSGKKPYKKQTLNHFSEKFLSKIFWTSNMALMAVKK